MSNQGIPTASRGVKTYWATPENPFAEPGRGGQAGLGRKGQPCTSLPAGERLVLASSARGPGMVRRIWATIEERDEEMLRGLVLEMRWDGAEVPAVRVPWGDFFGHPMGRMACFEAAYFAGPEGRSFLARFPMPFREFMEIAVVNESSRDVKMFFYDVAFTLGDSLPADALYFHSIWRRENPTMLRRDFEVLPMVRGKGRFLGMHAGVRVLQEEFGPTWWGEGEVKIYLDGDTTHATLVGTGTEDYVGTGWGLGLFAQRESGCHLCDREHECFGLYRFHDCDPVFFDDSVRVVIQQLGLVRIDHLEEVERRGIRLAHPDPNLPDYAPPRIRESGGSRIFERRDDWCACAYFYLDTPEGQHTSLPPLGERIEGLRGTDEGRERLD